MHTDNVGKLRPTNMNLTKEFIGKIEAAGKLSPVKLELETKTAKIGLMLKRKLPLKLEDENEDGIKLKQNFPQIWRVESIVKFKHGRKNNQETKPKIDECQYIFGSPCKI